jgi:hypothetical protein
MESQKCLQNILGMSSCKVTQADECIVKDMNLTAQVHDNKEWQHLMLRVYPSESVG